EFELRGTQDAADSPPQASTADPQQPYHGGAYSPQSPYGAAQPPPPAYGGSYAQSYTQGSPYQGAYGLQEHPMAQTVFITGILGIFIAILPFVAWYLGAQAKREIEQGAPYLWGGHLKSGYVLGVVFSLVALIGGIGALLFYFVIVGIVLG
ncbi:MAG: hypothetical protein ACK5KO_11115, partial [Arachnia sp.]